MRRWMILLSCCLLPVFFMGPGCNEPKNEFFGNFNRLVINGDPGPSLINLELTVKDEAGNVLYNETFANPAARTTISTDSMARFLIGIDPGVTISGAPGLPDGTLLAGILVPIAQVSPGAVIPFTDTMDPEPDDTVFAAGVIPEDSNEQPVVTVANSGNLVINAFDGRTLSASYSGTLNDIVVPSTDTPNTHPFPIDQFGFSSGE